MGQEELKNQGELNNQDDRLQKLLKNQDPSVEGYVGDKVKPKKSLATRILSNIVWFILIVIIGVTVRFGLAGVINFVMNLF